MKKACVVNKLGYLYGLDLKRNRYGGQLRYVIILC